MYHPLSNLDNLWGWAQSLAEIVDVMIEELDTVEVQDIIQ